MRGVSVLAVLVAGCARTEFPAECDLYPERCCDLRPTVAVCAEVGGEVATDTGRETDVGCAGPLSEPCGSCGTRMRACVDGVLGAWGVCGGEGVCKPGATEDVSGGAACPGALEVRTRTCLSTCAWDADVCALPKGWSKMADPPAGFAPRSDHAQAWTGAEYVVWGGANGAGDAYFASGGRWSLKTNKWTTMASPPTGLERRSSATAVATGLAVLIWGGQVEGGYTTSKTAARNTGFAYFPATNDWTPMAASPLSKRSAHAAVWTGTQMIVWGGADLSLSPPEFADGAAYDPSTDKWALLPPAPIGARQFHAMSWNGTEVVVYGGMRGSLEPLGDGATFNPSTGVWKKISAPPVGRHFSGVALTTSGIFAAGGFTVVGAAEIQSDALLLAYATGWSKTPSISSASLSNPARVFPCAWCRASTCWTWSGCSSDGSATSFLGKLKAEPGGVTFDLTKSTWAAMGSAGEPTPRAARPVDTGAFVVVWGGTDCAGVVTSSGAIYVP